MPPQAVTLTGVNVRSGPWANKKKIGLIPQGTLVKVLDKDSKQQTVGGKTGYWFKVSAPLDNIQGWVFGAFLCFGELYIPDPRKTKPKPLALKPTGEPKDPESSFPYYSGVNKPNGFMFRYRTHKTNEGGWIGPKIPKWLETGIDTLELNMLDEYDTGFLAFYRDPYGASSCSLGTTLNCRYIAAFYSKEGNKIWELALNDLFSSEYFLEIQDIRWSPPYLYFNEACQSYSDSVGGHCSSLAAVEPESGNVAWRSPDLVSNNVFIIHGDWIVAGYGFSAEPDYLFVLDRFTGGIVDTKKLDFSHQYLEVAGDILYAPMYEGVGWFRIINPNQ